MICGLLLSSCLQEKEDQQLAQLNPEIEAAKSWYEGFEIQNQSSENARKVKNGRGKPDWGRSKVYNQADGKKVIEVGFDFDEIAIPEHLKTEKLAKNSVLQTLLLFPNQIGDYTPYFLNIYPEDPDFKFELDDFQKGGYQVIPDDFSGSYRFYRWNGKFIGGWRIQDGVKTHRLKNPKIRQVAKSSRLNSGTLYCYQVETTWYTYTCVDGFGCTTPEEAGTTIDGYECEYVLAPPSPMDPDTGGGGGGTPPSGNECEQPEGNLLDVPVDCEEEEEMDPEEVIDYIENQLNKILNQCEKDLILSDPIYAGQAINVYLNSIDAQNKTIEIFGYNGWNDCSDAFRHAYWNALMTKSNGITSASLFASAHECVSGSPTLEHQMDLFNNNQGRSIALNNLNLNVSDLAILILNSLQNGDLKIISNLAPTGHFTLNSELINSSSCQN